VEALIAVAVGVLVASGIYLMLRGRTFPVILGLALFAYAVNLFLFSMGRLTLEGAPIIRKGMETADYTDPVPQALVLTAIVIGFAMTAFVMVLAIASYSELETDHVDGEEPES
jgi:multicomponent K+:H+ antiporter subunit C